MRKLLNWLRRGNLEDGLDRELRYHMERRVSDLVNTGMTEAEATRQATLELGGLTQVREEVRDVWLTRWLRDLVYDLRFSVRSFRRSPTFTATALLSLALGIGATTAIYSLVDQVLLHSLPVREPERLVLIDWKGQQVADGFGSTNIMSYPICRDLNQQDQFFDGVLCRHATTVSVSTGGDHTPAAAEIVSGTYFTVLGVGPALGRVLSDGDDGAPETSPVVVLSYDYWKTQFGGAPDVVGRKILVNRFPMTVVGVAAREFRGIDVAAVPALWIPAAMSSQAIPGWNRYLERRTRWMQVLGRLRPGMTPARAQAGLQPWFKSMLDEDTRRVGFPVVTPEQRREFLASTIEVTAAPQGHSFLRRRLVQPLWLLLAATAVLLSLACLNVAGLFLARASARDREISTRVALGASRGRIGRQLLADSVLLALSGGALAVAVAPLAMRALIAFLPTETAGTALVSALDSRLLTVAFLISLAAGVLTGFAPAWQAGRESVIGSLRERGGTAFGGVRLRKAIVTLQIAFTLILVIGAALFVRTLSGLMAKGPGFAASSLISFGIEPRQNGYSPTGTSQLIRRLNEEIRSSPSTETAAVARFQLLTGGSWHNRLTIQAHQRLVTNRAVHLNAVSPGFFATLGAKIVAGRDFDERDSRPLGENGFRTAVVNESLVRRYFGDRSPLGARICQGDGPNAKPDIEVIGVVSDFSYRGMREAAEQAFFSILEGEADRGSFYVRVRGTPDSEIQTIRAIVHKVDPELTIAYLRTVEEQVNRSLNTERMLATLSGAFSVLALVLSLVGLYGVMSYVVTQRTREIGIRLALGATRSSALWLVLRDALIMIATGTAIALPSAWALGRLVEAQLFGVKPTDAATLAEASLTLATMALCAALIPAYRAAKVNPTDALRFE